MFKKHICPLELVQLMLAFPVSDKFITIVYSKTLPHSLIGKPLSSECFFFHVQPVIWFPLLSVLCRNMTSCFSQPVPSLFGGWLLNGSLTGGLFSLNGQCNGWTNICLSGLGKTVNLQGNISSQQYHTAQDTSSWGISVFCSFILANADKLLMTKQNDFDS